MRSISVWFGLNFVRTVCQYEMHRSEHSGLWTFVWHVPSLTSVSIHWDHPGANRSLQSFCLPLKGRVRLCTFETRQAFFRDHALAYFTLLLPLEKFFVRWRLLTLPPSSPCISLCPIPVCPSTEQRRPSGLPNGRWPVCFGTNSPGRHQRLHTYCSSSYPSQVSAVTKFCSFHLYFIRTYQVSFPSW